MKILILLNFTIIINLIVTVKCALFAEEISDNTFLSANISVIYTCSRSHFLCSQISFRKIWSSLTEFEHPVCLDCSSLGLNKNNRAVLPISISNALICTPSYWNPDPKFISDGKLYLFIISLNHLQDKRYSDYSMLHKLAKKKIVYDLNIPNPNSRKPCLDFANSCSSFYHKLMHWSFSNWQSPYVQVPIPLAPTLFPSNYKMGYYISLPKLGKNQYFEKFMQSNYKRFTISLWIYISSHCSKQFCNVISFFEDSNESFTSPVLMLTNTGKIHFQVRYLISDSDMAFQTKFSIPTRAWNQIILSMDSFKWYLSIYSLDGSVVGKTSITRFSEKIKFNITKNFGIIGGSQVYDGTHGFFSDTFMYPGIFGRHKQIHESKKLNNSSLSMSHDKRLEGCEDLLNELHFYLDIIANKIEILSNQFSCPNLQLFETNQNEKFCAIRISDLKRPKIYSHLKRIILRDVNIFKIRKILELVDLRKTLHKESFLLANVVSHLRDHMMTKVMENLQINGIKINKIMSKYLQDCSCLGDPDANYILSAAYFYGMGAVRMNHSKALKLALINVDNHLHRLSLLALGNIHLLGLIPNLPEAASVFYKAAADFTPNDIEKFEHKDMYNDNIRLTNEAQIKEHTDEDGDLFEWIKHQASSGIPWAKQRLGRIFYWGGQGIRRNLNQAVNFFRQAAEAPEAEPGDHFDYGLLLVKKPNDDKDLEKGKAELKKAGKEDPRALTVLGWLAETKENNISKAYEYYRQAHSMGNADATFNLGIYYHYGRANVIIKSKAIAFKYFEKAAVQNQLDAGVMYSHYLMSGLNGFLSRDPKVGVNWARHVAEQNPKIGYYLSEGVRSYRKRHIELSVFYYLLAAFSGIELANFNVALLCDEKEEIVKKYVEKECAWYHYNLSVQREEHFINPYSLIKLGDRYWYGCLDGIRDINKSIEFYIRAAQKREPQAFFNLAFIFENESVNISQRQLKRIIRMPKSRNDDSQDWRYDVILALYEKCEDLSETDNYLPCRLAIQRLKLAKLWREMKMKIQIIVTIVLSLIMLYKFVSLWSQRAEINPNLSFP